MVYNYSGDIMLEKLKLLTKNSWAPSSNFRVSAIVEMKDGSTFGGVNVEISSYGGTICAERNAINSAIGNGYKKGDFKSLHVLCIDSKKISMPCFICRQTIVDFFDKDCIVTAYHVDGESLSYTVSELCPYPFESSDLN